MVIKHCCSNVNVVVACLCCCFPICMFGVMEVYAILFAHIAMILYIIIYFNKTIAMATEKG